MTNARPSHEAADPPSDHTDTKASKPTSRVDDRGEGVISAAIAVLVMAFLGALMWVGFQQMWEDDPAADQ